MSEEKVIPFGFCHCGCGLQTKICNHTDRRDGAVEGQPMRYIRGHVGCTGRGHHEPDPVIRAAKELEDRRRYKKEARARAKVFVATYLKTHPCVDCGESDPITLEFDHRNPQEKYKSVSQIVCGSLGIHVLENEIAKCDVRCTCCHRKRHAGDNWAAQRTS